MTEIAALKVVTGTNPAANTELGDTVPAAKAWHLTAYSVACVQGATQTPQPILVVKDASGNTIYESFGCTTAQAVSTTCQYTWAPGNTISGLIGATTNVHAIAPLPLDFILLPGYVISSNTIGIGANTNYGAPIIYVAEFTF